MVAVVGLTFDDARRKVIDTFNDIVKDSKERNKKSSWCYSSVDAVVELSVTPLVVIVLYAITLAASTPMSIMYPGTITTIVFMAIVMMLNGLIITLYRESERIEISTSLEKILNEYRHILINDHDISNHNSIDKKTRLGSVDFNASPIGNIALKHNDNDNIYLTSGHSQVSIVHTFRQV